MNPVTAVGMAGVAVVSVTSSRAIFGLVEPITTPFGVRADLEPLLRRLLFG